MRSATDNDRSDAGDGQVDYFGFRITVRNPHLAALLSGDGEDAPIVRTRCGEVAPPEGPEAPPPRSRGGPTCATPDVVQLRPVADEF